MAFSFFPEGALIILAIILLFGASAIPKLARSLGQAQGEFKKAKQEFDREVAAASQEKQLEGAGPSEEQIRRTARDLGIDEEGKDLATVKRLINEKLG